MEFEKVADEKEAEKVNGAPKSKGTGVNGFQKSPYSVIRKPRITEKSAIVGSYNNGIVFDVAPSANKVEIRLAVEKIYDVKVRAVRTANYMGKVKRVGRKIGRKKAWKKAYVLLQEGSSIDLIDGL